MPKNRFEEFVQIKAQYDDSEDENADEKVPFGQAYQSECSLEMDKNEVSGRNRFLNEMERMIGMTDAIKLNTKKLEMLQVRILDSPSSSESDCKAMADLSAENVQLAKDIKKLYEKEKSECQQLAKDTSNKSKVEHNMRDTQLRAQSQSFLKAWSEYNECQEQFRDRSKRQLVTRCRILNKDLTDEEAEKMLDQGQTNIFVEGIVTDEFNAKQQIKEIEARHHDFLNLEESLRQVHEMFEEIQILVACQAEDLDRIETYVTNTAIGVEETRQKLQHATKYVKRSRRKKIFALIAVLIIISALPFLYVCFLLLRY